MLYFLFGMLKYEVGIFIKIFFVNVGYEESY